MFVTDDGNPVVLSGNIGPRGDGYCPAIPASSPTDTRACARSCRT
jgi:hypothetical protein